MAASHSFEMNAFNPKAYGQDIKLIPNRGKDNWEHSWFEWEGPTEGIEGTKNFETSVSLTSDPTVNYGHVSALLPVPNYATTGNTNRSAKIIEINKMNLAVKVEVVKTTFIAPPRIELETAGLLPTILPSTTMPASKTYLKFGIWLYKRPYTFGTTNVTTLIYNDSTTPSAAWSNSGSRLPDQPDDQTLLFRKHMEIGRGEPFVEQILGPPIVTGTTDVTGGVNVIRFPGDLKIAAWGMENCCLFQRFSSNEDNNGDLFNAMILKVARLDHVEDVATTNISITGFWSINFFDRPGVDPKPSIYLNRFGEIETASGGRTNRYIRDIKANLDSKRPAKRSMRYVEPPPGYWVPGGDTEEE